MTRALSAGGKVFLSGEYAVLWGGTARIAAVEPRTQAMVCSREDRRVDLLLPDRRFSGASTTLGVHWEADVPAECLFAARAVDLALRVVGRDGPGLALALEASPQGPRGVKLGLGSSARTAVLAAEAVRYALSARYDALKLALVAHASAQGGRGSGADVAASFAGGVVRYRRWDAGPLLQAAKEPAFRAALDASPPVDLWRLPECRLPLAWAFSGQSASTPVLIQEIEARLGASGRERFAAQSDGLGQQLEAAVLHGDFPAAKEAFAGLRALLQSLGPLETEPLGRIIGIAETYGCAAKLSGAGGGDGAVVICPDLEVRSLVVEGLLARGFFALPLAIAGPLKGEPQAPPQLARWLDAAG